MTRPVKQKWLVESAGFGAPILFIYDRRTLELEARCPPAYLDSLHELMCDLRSPQKVEKEEKFSGGRDYRRVISFYVQPIDFEHILYSFKDSKAVVKTVSNITNFFRINY